MADENFFKRRLKNPRQKWEPHWIMKLLYTLLAAAWSFAKIAIGAAATVLLMVLICGTVFMGILLYFLQQCLYFLPLPQGQGLLRPTFSVLVWTASSIVACMNSSMHGSAGISIAEISQGVCPL